MADNETRHKKRITLRDIAAIANVSTKTVSNVVNNWPYVTEETRRKVQEAIHTLGYYPNRLARSLVTGQTGTIGIVLPDISNPFFGQAIRGCEDVLNGSGYSIFLCNTDENVTKECYYLDTLISLEVDGLILWGSRTSCDSLARFANKRLPVVAVDCAAAAKYGPMTSIDVDNVGGALIAMQHLLRQGRRVVAHLAGPAQRLTAQRRFFGYRRALEDAGIPYDPHLVIEGLPSIRGGYRAAMQLLSLQRPDALFCYNDLMAVGAMIACRQLGLSIPRDLALVGFDDIIVSLLVVPALTTVRIEQYELGKLAARLLLERLQDGDMAPKSMLFPVELQVRNSCGARRLSNKQIGRQLEHLVTSIAVDLPLTESSSGERNAI
jgi:LacI family transcriptional regulator